MAYYQQLNSSQMTHYFFFLFMALTNLPEKKNTDLDLILKWTYQWKMSFKPDKSEQIEEVGFPRKSSKVTQF